MSVSAYWCLGLSTIDMYISTHSYSVHTGFYTQSHGSHSCLRPSTVDVCMLTHCHLVYASVYTQSLVFIHSHLVYTGVDYSLERVHAYVLGPCRCLAASTAVSNWYTHIYWVRIDV